MYKVQELQLLSLQGFFFFPSLLLLCGVAMGMQGKVALKVELHKISGNSRCEYHTMLSVICLAKL